MKSTFSFNLPSIEAITSFRPYISFYEVYFTLAALGWLSLSIYGVYLGISYVDLLNPYPYLPRDQKFTLPDPLLDTLSVYFKKTALPADISDILVRFSLFLVFLRILLNGKKSFVLLRRVSYLVGFLYLLRVPFMIMTQFPNPLLDCVPNPHPNIFVDALLLIAQKRASCGDLMYSGHTVAFMTATLCWADYPLVRKYHSSIYFFSIFFGFFSVLSLVASSYHYTLDVVVSSMISLFSWKMYHYIATSQTPPKTVFESFIIFIDQEYYLDDSHISYLALPLDERLA